MAKVLVIGSGGREHALGWKLAQSSEVDEVLYAPGNAGTAQENKGRNVFLDLNKESFAEINQKIIDEKIDLTVIGPEKPLAEGLVNYLHQQGHRNIFGPSREAAKLESDKFYSWELMERLGIPQANSCPCRSELEIEQALKSRDQQEGIVIKARGLRGGKGVFVADSRKEALEELVRNPNQYGSDVLIAERLYGEEFSVFGISDGERVVPLLCSFQDHKQLFDQDLGPNTGGMGAYGPALIAGEELIKKINKMVMNPVVIEMKRLGHPYQGFLYAGMIMTAEGPKVIEFNVRFGDPECQPAMMLLKGDLYQMLRLSLEGKLELNGVQFEPRAACCVVLAAKGYPESYEKDKIISGLEEAEQVKGVKIFHAGTRTVDGNILTNGGRVLGVTASSLLGLTEAQKQAYLAVNFITTTGRGFHYRKDIGAKGLNKKI